jgi:hypothetical protein
LHFAFVLNRHSVELEFAALLDVVSANDNFYFAAADLVRRCGTRIRDGHLEGPEQTNSKQTK